MQNSAMTQRNIYYELFYNKMQNYKFNKQGEK